MLIILPILLVLLLSRRLAPEYVWYTCYYTISTIAGCILLVQNPELVFQCQEGALTSYFGHFYYHMQLAFYLAAFIFVTCIDRDNPDNDAMILIHHLFTLTIIFISQLFRFQKVGLVVLVLHDIVDIYLYASRYLRQQYGTNASITRIIFIFFVFCFVLLRLIFFPWYIFKKCVWNAKGSAHVLATAGLICLLALHVLWFVKIVKIIKNKILK